MNNFSFDKNLFLKSIIDNLPCQLLIIDKDMRICYVNSTLLEETGYSRIDLMGVNIQSIWPEHTLPKLLNANSGTRLMYRDIDNFYVQGGVWHENDLLGAYKHMTKAALKKGIEGVGKKTLAAIMAYKSKKVKSVKIKKSICKIFNVSVAEFEKYAKDFD